MKTRADLLSELDAFQRSVRSIVDTRDVDEHELSAGIPAELLTEAEQLASEFGAVAFHLYVRARRLARALDGSALAHVGRAVHRPGPAPKDGADE